MQNIFAQRNRRIKMASWVMFFIIWGKFGTSSIVVDFTTQQQCESAKTELSKIIPSNRDGYFKYSECLQK